MQISGKHVWQGSTVQFLKRKILTSLSLKFKQTHLCLVATSKPDQHNKAVRPFLKRANRVVRPEAHSRWSKERSPDWQVSITRILWYWVRLTVLIQCFFSRLVFPLSVLLPQGYQYKSLLWSATCMFTREGFFTCKRILPFNCS